MKRYILILSAAALLAASCVGDLNTTPLNKTDFVAETVYGADEATYIQGLAKIYFQFVSNDTKDLAVADGGASELIRGFWSAQETTTDEAKCAWKDDAWVRALNTDTWSEAQNDATYAVYVRTLQGITYANEYLRQTTADKLAERGVAQDVADRIGGYRAEARFLRAYFYWMAMDTFGDVPFTTEDDQLGVGFKPAQKPRAEVFAFCESELKDLLSETSAMPAVRSNYPRADKGAVAGLLARLYLNAEVYTSAVDPSGAPGTPMWAEAKAMCETIFGMGYSLCSDYASLFRGDNGQNPDALKELIFTADYDSENTRSYGGTTYLLFASLSADEVSSSSMPTGVNTGWAGLRAPWEFIEKFFRPLTTPNYSTGVYLTGDKRADGLFQIKGRKESMNNDNLYQFLNGWTCWKFNNIPSTETEMSYLETSKTKSYSDIDFPLIRLGEIYLIYAEACMHLGEVNTALPNLAALSKRAGVEAPTAAAVTENWLMAERARELYWEGHRRTDLIRYGLFHSDKYIWPYKGSDAFKGRAFDEYMNVFAIPPTELASNDALYQNYGYPVPTK